MLGKSGGDKANDQITPAQNREETGKKDEEAGGIAAPFVSSDATDTAVNRETAVIQRVTLADGTKIDKQMVDTKDKNTEEENAGL